MALIFHLAPDVVCVVLVMLNIVILHDFLCVKWLVWVLVS